MKNQYIGRDWLKETGAAGTGRRFKGVLARKKGGVLLGGLTLTQSWPKDSLIAGIYLNYHLAVLLSILGHSQGDSLTNLISIIFFYFDPKMSRSLVTKLGPQGRPSV